MKIKKIYIFYLLLTFLIILSITTQYIAYRTNYHSSLGKYYLINGFKVYLPWRYFTWNQNPIFLKNIPDTLQKAKGIFSFGSLIAMGFVLIIARGKKQLDLHGTARWATRSELKEMNVYSSTNEGVVIGCDEKGNILRNNGVEHILLVAGTRQGKGVNTGVPTGLNWPDSMVVTDIKGELWGLTAGYRQKVLKQKVLHFNPVDVEGISCSYNPLDFIKIGTFKELQDATVIAQTLIDTDGKAESDHWIGSAINFLIGVLLHVKYANPNANLGDVVDFLNPVDMPLMHHIADILGFPREGEEEPTVNYSFNHLKHFENKELFKELHGKDTLTHPIVAQKFAAIFSTPDKERGSIISSANKKLEIFLDPLIRKHTKISDFTVQDLMKERVTLYLVVPPETIDRCRPLLRLIITQMVYGLTKTMKFENKKKTFKDKTSDFINKYKEMIENYIFIKPKKNRILFMLDEFPSLGKLGIVESAMSYIAGYGLKVLLIAQSLKQLEKIYGKANFFKANCSIQIYLTPNEIEDAEQISKTIGNKTVRVFTKQIKGAFDIMPIKTESFVGRPLMTPSEVMTMPYENLLIFITGKKPIYGRKLMYFKNKKYINKLYETPKESDSMVIDLEELDRKLEEFSERELIEGE